MADETADELEEESEKAREKGQHEGEELAAAAQKKREADTQADEAKSGDEE